MRIFESHTDIPQDAHGAVIVIGNFDGVHRAHAALIARARDVADKQGASLAVLTFEPHPRALFRPDEPPFRITPPALKADRLAALGVDILFRATFDWDFASQSAESFVQGILLSGLRPAHIVVGYDFRFGQLRKGDADTIRAAGIPVTVVEEVADEDNGKGEISSSRIRQALRLGRVNEANRLLGWEWEIHGIVTKGDQRGREFGFPTANVPLGNTVHPAYGVYAARVLVEGETQWRNAALNIGIKPMFEVPQADVEAHIFDFNREIYGLNLRVKPVRFLRGEAKFASVDELIAQIDTDCQEIREILA